jgi:hypothetical protein
VAIVPGTAPVVDGQRLHAAVVASTALDRSIERTGTAVLVITVGDHGLNIMEFP